jgi:hypothetical protein
MEGDVRWPTVWHVAQDQRLSGLVETEASEKAARPASTAVSEPAQAALSIKTAVTGNRLTA